MQVVDDDDRVAVLQQVDHRVRADVAGAARHQNTAFAHDHWPACDASMSRPLPNINV